MKILIIGGTRFQGPYLVRELLEAGHTVTVFHLGSHAIKPHSGLTDIVGDRTVDVDLARLIDYEFDTCIDTCAYFPEQVALLAKTVKIRRYCLISSVYVYADREALLCENAPLLPLPASPVSVITPDNYGSMKMLCEKATLEHFGDSSLILRPSIIIGTGDHTERLLFWMRLAALHGKRIDVFNRPPVVQLVDVRDLTRFIVKSVEKEKHGTVNVCGEPVSLTRLLDSIESITGRQLEGKYVQSKDLGEFSLAQLPYCENAYLARYSSSRSYSWGYAGRNLLESLTDIYADYQLQGFSMHNFKAEEIAVLRLFA